VQPRRDLRREMRGKTRASSAPIRSPRTLATARVARSAVSWSVPIESRTTLR
jgi:hypothetical protein